jgi:hypothetical protein
LVIFLTFCDYLLLFATSFVFCNILFFLIFVISLIFCNYLKVFATQISCGIEEIWVGPQCKALGPNLTTLSNPIGRNLDDLGRHPFGPVKWLSEQKGLMLDSETLLNLHRHHRERGSRHTVIRNFHSLSHMSRA